MKTALSGLGQRTQAPPITWLMQQTLGRPKLISLAAGFTDNATLPVGQVRALLTGLLGSRRTGEPALQYGATAGLSALRQLTAERLWQQDTTATGAELERELYAADNLLITHGSQQLLYLVTECLCDAEDIVLVEDPTYFVYLGITQSLGLRCRGLRRAADGIDLGHLEQTLESLQRSRDLSRVKYLYLVSYFQNPTSITTSVAKKAAALKLLRRYERAAGHPLYLVEDAAYRELRFAGGDTPSALTAPGGSDRVIYAGTYSKPFATGVRVGFGWLPADLREVVTRVKGNHDFGTASLLQHLLTQALGSGVYERHLAKLRRRYARKAATLTRALRQHFPASVQWRPPAGGMYVWAVLPPSLTSGRDSELFRRALDQDVLYVPGALCYAPDPTRPAPDHEMRLSFGGASEPELILGIERLGRVIREMMV